MKSWKKVAVLGGGHENNYEALSQGIFGSLYMDIKLLDLACLVTLVCTGV
jgi:hypothetical protein